MDDVPTSNDDVHNDALDFGVCQPMSVMLLLLFQQKIHDTSGLSWLSRRLKNETGIRMIYVNSV